MGRWVGGGGGGEVDWVMATGVVSCMLSGWRVGYTEAKEGKQDRRA